MLDKEGIIGEVRDYLDAEDWRYEYDGARGVIKAGVNLSCKLQSARLIIHFNESGYTSLAVISMQADEKTRANVAEFLTRANYGARNGNFEMDYRDGEIRYKVYVNTKGMKELPRGIIEDSIIIPNMMFQRYGDGLAAILFGFSTPEEEINKIEKR